MTSEERTAIKLALETHTRNRLTATFKPEECCKGCGMPWEENTPGCPTCWQRHRMRQADKQEYNRLRMRRVRAQRKLKAA